MRKRNLLCAAAGTVIATALAGGAAWAAIPDGNGLINGCYQKNVGNLRVVSSTSSCRTSELPIVWNRAGTPGVKGDPGLPGPDGRDGRDGSSVSVAPEPAGPNCAAGGAKLIAANGVVYVCNATPSDPGPDG
jgi:hypothetical protein